MNEVYLNGRFLPAQEACIPVLDRGFLFGDGVYEVIPVYGGRPFRPRHHLLRLDASLAGIGMSNPLSREEWKQVMEQLCAQQPDQDQQIYLQVTRGVEQTRRHMPSEGLTATVFAMATPLEMDPARSDDPGIAAVIIPDQRWGRCDIKAIALLANILAKRQAHAADADEAILVRDGEALEGAASNLFMVSHGCLITPPKGPHLLPGITRDLVLELAAEAQIPSSQCAIQVDELRAAEEVWITSSTREIRPVIRLDGHPVGNGEPGPMWRLMLDRFRAYKTAFAAGAIADD